MDATEKRIANLSSEQRKLLDKKSKAMKKNTRKSEILLTLQEGDPGKRRPIFFIHPPLGVTGYFLNVVRYLVPEQPVYGIQCPALLNIHDSFDSYEEMADYYLQAIRTVQPEPPYFLIAHSSGAYTIYEMALQLKKHRDNVPVLAVIDSAAPMGEIDAIMAAYDTPDLFENDEAMFVAAWLVSLAHNQELTFSLDELKSCRTVEEKYELMAGFLKQSGFIPMNANNGMVKVVLQMIANHTIADKKYFAKHTPDGSKIKYEGRTVLFRCTAETHWPGYEFTSPPDTSEFSGWEKFCSGPIDVIGIPDADHLTIVMEPCVKSIADHLQTYLDEVTPLNS